MNESFDVKNKIALVTGANRGIGKAIVESLINHGASKIYAAVRNLDSAQSLQDEFSGLIHPIEIDLNQVETIKKGARQAKDVEIVINNAGVLTDTSVLSKAAVESLRFEFETNVFGLINIAQFFSPILIKHKGAFVQINSVASVRAVPFIGTYSASKAAAYSVTQSLSQELSDQGVSVLSVHPGPIATDMANQAGITESAEPPSIVAEGIIKALKAGEFHLFPDSLAEKVGERYASYAESVIEQK